MIHLPLHLTPSELVCCEELPSFVDDLLQSSRSLRKQCRIPEAERCARDSLEASQEPSTKSSYAVALIHLADLNRQVGKLGPALAECQRAYRIFQHHVSRYQRHNEAVAAYALGLVYQLLGSDMDALRLYRESDQLFERVKEDWAAVNALTQVEACTRVQRWIGTLRGYLTTAQNRANTNHLTGIRVPIILSDSEEIRFAVAELDIDEYVVARRLTVNGESFRMQNLTGTRRISMATGVEYYALEIPAEAHETLGASEGDYALVRREKSPNQVGPGVLEMAGEPEFGSFQRDDEGNVHFVRSDATVIGEEDIGEDVGVGYIIALLKPS
jgi:tetratricopeptide (TPR) repeat protein